MNSLSVLHSFILMFDNEDGFPPSTYMAVFDLITHVIGKDAAFIFGNYIKATDGKFYFKNSEVCDECWKRMLNPIPEPQEAN